MTTTTELRINRMQLPSVEVGPNDETMWGRHDTYAKVTCGPLVAEVLRFAFWEDGAPLPVEVSYEVRIDGMRDNQGGTCELYSTEPAPCSHSPRCAGQRRCCWMRLGISGRTPPFFVTARKRVAFQTRPRRSTHERRPSDIPPSTTARSGRRWKQRARSRTLRHPRDLGRRFFHRQNSAAVSANGSLQRPAIDRYRCPPRTPPCKPPLWKPSSKPSPP
jgi:hypothetical protein